MEGRHLQTPLIKRTRIDSRGAKHVKCSPPADPPADRFVRRRYGGTVSTGCCCSCCKREPSPRAKAMGTRCASTWRRRLLFFLLQRAFVALSARARASGRLAGAVVHPGRRGPSGTSSVRRARAVPPDVSLRRSRARQGARLEARGHPHGWREHLAAILPMRRAGGPIERSLPPMAGHLRFVARASISCQIPPSSTGPVLPPPGSPSWGCRGAWRSWPPCTSVSPSVCAMTHAHSHHPFERGLVDYAARLSAPKLPLHAPWSFEGRHDTTRIRLSLQWSNWSRCG